MTGADGWRREMEAQLLASAEVKRRTAESCGDEVLQAAEVIAGRLRSGGKLLLCGNGGSAADAQHLAAELVGRLDPALPRRGLAAIALTTDTSVLTAVGNDFAFELVFQRQVEALARPGDVLVTISTSGRSPNVLRAVEEAQRLGVLTIGLTGEGRSPLAEAVDLNIAVPSRDTQRIQEAHIAIGHVICLLVERMLTEQEREAQWATGRISG